MTIEHSNPTDLSPPPTGVYSHMVAASGKQLFIAGQLPRDKAGKLYQSAEWLTLGIPESTAA